MEAALSHEPCEQHQEQLRRVTRGWCRLEAVVPGSPNCWRCGLFAGRTTRQNTMVVNGVCCRLRASLAAECARSSPFSSPVVIITALRCHTPWRCEAAISSMQDKFGLWESRSAKHAQCSSPNS
jgi:hypothetical protein